MVDYFKKIINNRFAKNIAMIAGGTAFAQIIGTLAMPIITRLYNPQEYGVLTVYMSCIGLFTGSQSLRYELGIPIAEDEREATNVFFLSTLILIVLSSFLFLLTQISSIEIFSVLSIEKIYDYRTLIPLGFFLTGIYQIYMMWSFRSNNYKAIAATKLNRSIGANIIKVVLGLTGIGPIGLLWGYIFGESSGTITLAKPVMNHKFVSNIKKTRFKEVKDVWIKYIKFPKYSLPSNFLSKAGDQIPVLFIASLYGSQVIGYYGLSKSIIALPTMLIGNSIGDVFYGEAAAIGKSNPTELKKISSQIFKKLFFIGLIPLVLFIITAPELFNLLFGPSWYEAGIYARILSIWAFSQLVFQPISRIYDIFGRQKELFIITLTRIILILMIFFAAKKYSINSYVAILAYSLTMFLIYLITYLYSRKILHSEIERVGDNLE